MRPLAMRHLVASAITVFLATSAAATDNCAADAMIVFDGSGSMAEMGFNNIDEPRIFEARRAVAEAMPQVAQFRRLGLIVYGPDGADECSGITLRFPPRTDAAADVIAAVDALQPAGSTALAAAVEMAAVELDHTRRPATIVLVTDGKDTCGGTPCTLATTLANDGVETTVHIVGFKVRSDFFSWEDNSAADPGVTESVARCLADETGGTYTHAETVQQLVDALIATLGCRLLF